MFYNIFIIKLIATIFMNGDLVCASNKNVILIVADDLGKSNKNQTMQFFGVLVYF